jgi:3-oxoacyl-[acyl-carrier protein] reductase
MGLYSASMDLGISGRVALVTGASKGLGRGIAEALIAEGATVAISSRDLDRITRTAEEIGAHPFTHDAADTGAAAPLAAAVANRLGPIEILVVNSGGPPAGPDALGFTLEQWRAAYELLLLGQLALIEATLPTMRERKHGRILSISSSVTREPSPNLMLSTAHRSGLLAALKVIARQVAPDGVTVNSILPGVIATDRARELGADEPERVKAIPAGRLGTVPEFAAVAAFLCSEPAAYITGTTLVVDGGASRAI